MNMKSLAVGALFALTLPMVANAATVVPTGLQPNKFIVNFDGTADFGSVDNADGVDDADLGLLNLADDDIGITGIVTSSAPSGSITFDVKGPNTAAGALQLIIQFAGNTLMVDTATFDGSPIALGGAPGGMAGSFSADLSGGATPTFFLQYSGASGGETINIGIAAVPVPAAGFLLLGGLGGLAALKRRKKA